VNVEKKIRIMTVSRSLISPQISGKAYFLEICFSLRRISLTALSVMIYL